MNTGWKLDVIQAAVYLFFYSAQEEYLAALGGQEQQKISYLSYIFLALTTLYNIMIKW